MLMKLIAEVIYINIHSMNFKGKSFITLKDFGNDEILYLLDLAAKLKREKNSGIYKKRLADKNVALIFEKLSTRTRCAFSTACADEGAYSDFLGKQDIHLGTKESVEDTARVLGRMFDGIAFRGFSTDMVRKLAEHSGVPVWNGLTDDFHPTQALADFMTVREHFGRIEGINLTFVGDGRNNVCNSLMIASSKLGANITVCAPKRLFPDRKLVTECNRFAGESGGSIRITEKVQEGVKGADAVYTDVWCSMGEEDKAAERLALLKGYQVNTSLMSLADENAIFLHCLPAVKGNEVTEMVFESKQSLVFDQAENRMHTIKAIMVATLG